jgi:hypothetical protein
MRRQRRRRLHDAGLAKTMYRREQNKWKKAKQMGNGFLDFCSDAQGIEACAESHPRPTNLELELVYVIRAPGAGG